MMTDSFTIEDVLTAFEEIDEAESSALSLLDAEAAALLEEFEDDEVAQK